MNRGKNKAPGTESLIYASRTNVGCVREHNEDNFATQPPLFVVADGMGGHEAGEVASEIAVNTMLANFSKIHDGGSLGRAVQAANHDVIRGASDGTGKPGMGCTMTAVTIVDDKLTIAQVGDSRAYLLHDGKLQQLTRDHSLVADMVDQGSITREEARVHPMRSVITRALGSDPKMEPDIYNLHIAEGDRLLLCSDGLTSMVDDPEIEAILLVQPDPETCCDNLIQEALSAGGADNITALVVDRVSASEARANKERAEGRRHIPKAPFIFVAALVVVIVAAALGVNAYARSSYYLIDQDGSVAIYQGLPGDFAGVIRLSWLQEQTDVPVDQLPISTAQRLEEGIQVDSLEEAQNVLASYREQLAAPAATTDAGSVSSTEDAQQGQPAADTTTQTDQR